MVGTEHSLATSIWTMWGRSLEVNTIVSPSGPKWGCRSGTFSGAGVWRGVSSVRRRAVPSTSDRSPR